MFAFFFIQALSYYEIPEIEIPAGISNADACSVCKTVVSAVQSALKNSKVQSYVKSAALSACSKLSNSVLKTLCNTIVNNFLTTIMNFASSGLAKASICQRIKLCSSNDGEEYEVEEENSIATCAMCLAQQIAIYGPQRGPFYALKNCPSICAKNSNDEEYEEIEEGMENSALTCAACIAAQIALYGNIAGPIRAVTVCKKQCSTNGVDEDNGIIMTWASCLYKYKFQGVKAIETCKKLLGNSNEEVATIDEGLANSAVACAACVAAQVALKGAVLGAATGAILCRNVCFNSNSEEEEVTDINTLDEMIDFMKCYAEMVKKYGPVAGVYYANAVCRHNVLSKNDEEIEPIEIPEGISNFVACTFCQTIVNGVKSILSNTSVQSEISNLAAQLCTKVPSLVQGICTTIVSQYLPKVISYISQGMSASAICAKIGLC
ncbi:surfactant B protein [Histomonas meleagridis]|uniref:surfactant B protein n=1 Tax=Histomonas meleagridis TaxID=135588 RepID=UPI003559EEEE|nr:surfactant B protein [Histomonas meleagridis]KAH0805641.1 surfactant B protein [Histomonas meleagridis]